MIVYFADRNLNIIGNASTFLSGSRLLIDDIKKEDVDTGISSFEGKILFSQDDRLAIENVVKVGNTIFRYNPGEYQTGFTADSDKQAGVKNRFAIDAFRDVFTIVETEIDTHDQTLYFYAEDAGLDLLNNIVGSYSNANKTITTYVNATIEGTGFVLKNNIPDEQDKTLSLAWTDNDTVISRLQSIAEAFKYEFSFGFDIVGMSIVKRWVSFVKERGRDTEIPVAINRRVDNILVKKSITNMATALVPVGKDGLTLEDYNWSDEEGDFHTAGLYLVSEKALKEWGRFNFGQSGGKGNHIFRAFSCEAETQLDLKDQALEELKKRIQPEINYDVDIADLPEGVGIGDRITVVDDNAELYISGRILKLETSVTQNYRNVTLGEWKIKNAGISAKVQELASAFSKLAKNRALYTWIAYADSIDPVSGISKDSADKEYIGLLPNQVTSLEDATIADIQAKANEFKWSRLTGPGADGIVVQLESSAGYIFKGSEGNTILKAVVYIGENRITSLAQLQDLLGSTATLIWSEKIGSAEFVDILDTDERFVGSTKFVINISTDNTSLANFNIYRARVSFIS